ncbi:hypothetical protein C7C45_13650 [Micromonospora arborensis]|uniref:Uncharacterized protein n=1 Tax=Micromonospora arborensis TaxID=2116518 RepID=A0A318NKJ2_9ACTN|nr:hypothetical protein [Micromonospora arborensis]PYC70419.1 hypothetical protein C7C45_13650 [Micromonospora arborensis]
MSHDTVDDLRNAWLATIAAADRAGAYLHGAGPPGRRLPWQDAVTECWRALSLVYAGLAADRRAPTGSAGDLLAGLRAARVDADRAAALAARVRWRLGATEDRLRRTRIVADAVAARRFAAAITRLDLVGARLAVGGCRIDRSVAALTGKPAALTGEPATLTGEPAAPPHRPTSASHEDADSRGTDEIARGCHLASMLVTRRRRQRRRLTMLRERRW